MMGSVAACIHGDLYKLLERIGINMNGAVPVSYRDGHIVHQVIAIVIQTILQLGHTGVDVHISIITIRVIRYKSGKAIAIKGGDRKSVV